MFSFMIIIIFWTSIADIQTNVGFFCLDGNDHSNYWEHDKFNYISWLFTELYYKVFCLFDR